jgi:hypothetical protein
MSVESRILMANSKILAMAVVEDVDVRFEGHERELLHTEAR